MAKKPKTKPSLADEAGRPADGTISAAELMKCEFPELEFVMDRVVPSTGLTLWVGKPKVGKSWAMLELAAAAAEGREAFGFLRTKKSRVLYAALEDSMPRMQRRLKALLGECPAPTDLLIVIELPRADKAGLDELRSLVTTHRVDLVIIDVLQRVRPTVPGRDSDYAADYKCLADLHGLALELGIALIVVHHGRKQDGADALDTVSGTTGLAAAADTIVTIRRLEEGGYLWEGRGRDIDEIEWFMALTDGRWSKAEDEPELTPEQLAIFEALPPAPSSSSPKEVAAATGISAVNVRQTLGRLTRRGTIERAGHGRYCRPSHCHDSQDSEQIQGVAA